MARITLYLALLAATFVVAFAVGRVLDASPPGADDPTSATHAGSEHA